jgi:hypothetical protein
MTDEQIDPMKMAEQLLAALEERMAELADDPYFSALSRQQQHARSRASIRLVWSRDE